MVNDREEWGEKEKDWGEKGKDWGEGSSERE